MSIELTYFIYGCIFTFVCAFIPYWRSSSQLKNEAARLAKISTLVTRALEEAGIAKFRRNEQGEPIGLVISELVIESAQITDDIDASPQVAATKT